MYLPPCRISVKGSQGSQFFYGKNKTDIQPIKSPSRSLDNADPAESRVYSIYDPILLTTVTLPRLPTEIQVYSSDQSVMDDRGYYTGRGYSCHSMRIQNRTDPNLASIVSAKRNGDAVRKTLFPPSPLTVGDFELPGSHPIRVQQERRAFIRDVIVCNVRGMQDFVIRPSHSIPFAILTTQLNSWYKANAKDYPAPEIQNLVRGGHYVAFAPKSKNWCRVSAVNWKKNGEVLLEMLDFGGYVHTFVREMRFIRKIFCEFPTQAIHAKIQLAHGGDFEVTDVEDAKFKALTEGNVFSVMTISDKVDTVTRKRVLGVILMYNDDRLLEYMKRPYTF